jgi:lipopolysaccharide transport system ATP-binding protein
VPVGGRGEVSIESEEFMGEPAIRVENLGKRYRVSHEGKRGYQTLRESLVSGVKGIGKRLWSRSAEANQEDFWALKDISFEVKPGEVVGIIGRNGAGKSTLLKVLSRITKPTTGRVTLNGRVGSLLEVGTGFHPELTGRENVYLNGSILGMSRREIEAKFDEIVAFAEVEKFLDTPVKRYSSGMYVRLAFAVAAHLEPEILIVDEVLAVGDTEFQKKCLGKMQDVSRGGRTVLFVSHNMTAVKALCARTVLLVGGCVELDDNTEAGIAMYMRTTLMEVESTCDLRNATGREAGNVPALSRVTLRNDEGAAVSVIGVGESLTVAVEFDVGSQKLNPVLGVVIKDQYGAALFGNNNRVVPGYRFGTPVSSGELRMRFPRVPLMPGRFTIDLYLGNDYRDIDTVLDAIRFEVHEADVFGGGKLPPPGAGPFVVPAEWQLISGGSTVDE